jgi:hypothetical protein
MASTESSSLRRMRVHLGTDLVANAGGLEFRRQHGGGAVAVIGETPPARLGGRRQRRQGHPKPQGFVLNRRIVRLGVIAQRREQHHGGAVDCVFVSGPRPHRLARRAQSIVPESAQDYRWALFATSLGPSMSIPCHQGKPQGITQPRGAWRVPIAISSIATWPWLRRHK